jgi:hypothetical protein
MANKNLGNLIGSWAFLIGVILAIVVGIFAGLGKAAIDNPAILIILLCAGLLVGLFNITSKEVSCFLMSGIALIIASIFGMGIMSALPVVSSILVALLVIFVPSTIVVAVKNVFSLAKN